MNDTQKNYNILLEAIETALVTLLNYLVNKYEITLVLEKRQGIFLDELDSRITVMEYSPSNNKFVFIYKLLEYTH